jgi:glycosyltransferase involved in cell wall biosynthesis
VTTAQRDGQASRTATRPRLGVVATHPIQYQAPLYQELARRGVVDLEVAYLSSMGAEPFRDPDFGVTLAWDIDLLGGYRSAALPRRPLAGKPAWVAAASRWLRRQDIVVLHGHADPEMLLAAATCRALGVPYLLRGDSQAESSAAGARRALRHLVAGAVVRGAAGALPIGERNAAFYRRYAPLPQFRAPYSVDTERFRLMADEARHTRGRRLASLGLDPGRPVVVFSGKLIGQKRPLDLAEAVGRCGGEVSLLVLGDGPLRPQLDRYERHLPVRCLGFINQAELPSWYAAGDILALPSGREPWGLVVNEGMACGLVPVVSDAVGCGPDLVAGIGEIFPAGNIGALACALTQAAREAPARRALLPGRLAGFTIGETASGYERAAVELARRPRLPRRRVRLLPRRAAPGGHDSSAARRLAGLDDCRPAGPAAARLAGPPVRRVKDSRTTASQSRTIPGIPASSAAQSEPASTILGKSRMMRNAPCTPRRRSVTSSRMRIRPPSRNIPTMSGTQPPCRYRSPSGVTSDEVTICAGSWKYSWLIS